MISGRQWLAVWAAFFLGVLVADKFVVAERFYIICLCLALVCGLFWRLGWCRGLFYSLSVLAFVLGVCRMEYAEQQFTEMPLAAEIGKDIEISGQVTREPDEREFFTQLYVEVDDELLLVRGSRFLDAKYGDIVTVTGTLDHGEPFLTETGRVFDYPSYLQARGVQYVVSFAEVSVIRSSDGHPIVSSLLRLKQQFADRVQSALPPPQSDLGLGLLLGVKQSLGEDLEGAFRRTGLIHIVVLSGYNVMLVIAFFWWVTSWVLQLRGRVVVSVIGIVLFAIMVGLSATVVRASIMAGILLLAKLIGARYDVLRALLFAGLVMVALNPYLLLYDLGFQLSFMATLGLVLFLPVFEEDLATKTRQLSLLDIFWATLTTQIFVLPLLLFHIGEVSLVAILVNVLVLPVVAIAMLLTFVTGLAAFVSLALAAPFALMANLVLSYIIVVVEWFDRLPFTSLVIPPIAVWQLVGLYGLIGLGGWVWQKRSVIAKQSTVQFVTDRNLSDWQIVEEFEVHNKDERESSLEDSRSSEPPVFLR